MVRFCGGLRRWPRRRPSSHGHVGRGAYAWGQSWGCGASTTWCPTRSETAKAHKGIGLNVWECLGHSTASLHLTHVGMHMYIYASTPIYIMHIYMYVHVRRDRSTDVHIYIGEDMCCMLLSCCCWSCCVSGSDAARGFKKNKSWQEDTRDAIWYNVQWLSPRSCNAMPSVDRSSCKCVWIRTECTVHMYKYTYVAFHSCFVASSAWISICCCGLGFVLRSGPP